MNVNGLKHTLTLTLAAFWLFSTGQADAHSLFKAHLSAKFPNKKFTCNVCHVAGQKKDVKNAYGKLFVKVMNKPKLTADWKAFKDRTEKKKYEKEVMLPAFDAALTKISKMTFADLVKYNMIEGVKGDVPAEPWKPGSDSKAMSDDKAMKEKGSGDKKGSDSKP